MLRACGLGSSQAMLPIATGLSYYLDDSGCLMLSGGHRSVRPHLIVTTS